MSGMSAGGSGAIHVSMCFKLPPAPAPVIMHLVAIVVLNRSGLGIPLFSRPVVTADRYLQGKLAFSFDTC